MQFDIEFVGQVAILKVYNVNFQNLQQIEIDVNEERNLNANNFGEQVDFKTQ